MRPYDLWWLASFHSQALGRNLEMSPCDVVNWPHSQALGRSLGMSPCDVVNWPHSQTVGRNLGMSPCDMLMMAMYVSLC